MKPSRVTLITGGSRSGKSRFAREKMAPFERKIFLATAVAIDPEMEKRIAKHRKERGGEYLTVEEPLHLAEAIREHAASADAILVDCLTFWLNNLFHHLNSDEAIQKEIQNFLKLLDERPASLVLVTNEINMGVIPPDPLSRRFVDRHGWLNQEVARRSDEVVLMVSGIPQVLKKNVGANLCVRPLNGILSDSNTGETHRSAPTGKISIWEDRIRSIPSLNSVWRERARKRLREQTRPEGSLGELERYLERLVAIQEKENLSVVRKRVVLFAADHGVEAEGVSLYPREVTQAMVYNFLSGGATINAFARFAGAEVQIIDVGVDHDFEGHPGLISKKVRRGTSNIRRTQAMTSSELLQALETGCEIARQAKIDGIELLGIGEMGIGNTTAASAVVCALTKSLPEIMTGRGTGIDDASLAHKVRVVEDALRVNQSFLTDPLSILQSLGGFEIAALAGCVAGAAAERIPCVADGWIASAAALVPIQMNASLLDYLFFAHESEERGHRLLLEELDTRPLLRLGMRLGEGTGACLAMGILEAAVRAYNEVATFEEAKVAGKRGK